MATKKKPDFSNLSAYELPPEEVERLLRTGESEELLVAYFGQQAYSELRELSRKPRSAGTGKRVLVLPGIMGSMIGKRRLLLHDTIWFDPASIIAGDLQHLSLESTKRCSALGILPLYYTRLKLSLARHGFDVDYHYYDWRLSLEDLGQELAERIADDAGGRGFPRRSQHGRLGVASCFGGHARRRRQSQTADHAGDAELRIVHARSRCCEGWPRWSRT